MKKRIIIALSILLLVISTMLWWLCYTQAGLRFVIARLEHLPSTSIKIQSVAGTLAGPLHIDQFELDNKYVHVVAHQLDLDLYPALLLSGWIAAHGTINDVTVTLKQYTHSPGNQPVHFLPSFLHVYASSILIKEASFVHYNGFTIDAKPVNARLTLSRNQLTVSNIDAQGEWFTAKGTFRLSSGLALTLESKLDAALKPARGAALQGIVNMQGDTGTLNFTADIQQPNRAHSTATLTFPNHSWLISGHAQTDRWLLTPWLANAPLSFSNGNFDYTMDDTGIHLKGDVIVPEWATTALQVDADGKYKNKVIALTRADVSEKTSHIQTRTTGDIVLGGSYPRLDLQTQWSYLQWPIQAKGKPYFRSNRGSATLKGDMPYQYAAEAQLSTTNLADSSFTASGKLSTDHIEVTQADWQAWKGVLLGTGQLTFAKPRSWQFDVQARDVNPAALSAEVLGELPGQVSFSMQGKGADVSNVVNDFDIAWRNLDGSLRKQAIHGEGHLVRHDEQWQADHVALRWGDASLNLQGSTGIRNDVHWRLNAPALQQFDAGVSGQLSMEGSLQGTKQEPRLTLKAQSSSLIFKQWKLNGINLDTDVDLSDRTASRLSVSAKQFSHGDYSISQLVADAQGQASSHDLSLRGVLGSPITDDQQLSMNIHGQYTNENSSKHGVSTHHIHWRGNLASLDIKNSQLHAELNRAAEFSIEHDAETGIAVALRDFCMHVQQAKACGSGAWQHNGPWQLQASINDWPFVLEHAGNGESTQLVSNVNVAADLHGTADQPLLGSAQLSLNDASIRYQAGGHNDVLPITLGAARINADTQSVVATASLHIASDTTAEFNITSAHGTNHSIDEWPLHGSLSLHSQDAKLIPVFVHEVDRAGGELRSNINIAGTFSAPQLGGTIELSKGELDFYRWNLALRELQLNAQLNDDAIQFTAQGNAGQGTLNTSGDLNWRGHLTGKMQLHGDRLLLADSPEYHITASPSLQFDIKNENGRGVIDVTGDVLIPSAKLQPQDITNAVQISADARFKDDALYARNSDWQVNSNVSVKLGDDVHVDGMGLQGQLGGEVMTRLRTSAVASGRGELTIIDGHYEAYGRKLDIKRGRLLFDNTPLDNPGLDIQAERVINDVNLGDITVGVNVRGFLRDPRLQFYSDPSMSQTQIVSYLVIGKPFDQLQGTETTTVRSATSSLALQGGGYLAGKLGRRIGLEEAGVETDANNQSAFVLGTFLSPRLYVSYGISLTQAINTLKLRYSVSKHWTLKTEAGEAKSADVEFRIDR